MPGCSADDAVRDQSPDADAPAGRPVRSRDFALFLTARAAARLGETMLPVALAAGLLHVGYDAGAVGLAMAAPLASFVALILFGGVFADRVDTRRLMIAADLARVATQALTAALFFSGHVVLWQVCAIGAVSGAATAVFQPGVASTIPALVDDVQKANGAIRVAESVMALAGPALAGVGVAFAPAGGVFVLHAGTYLLSAVCLLLIRHRPQAPEDGRGRAPGGKQRPTSVLRDLQEGWQEFTARTWLWSVIVIWCVLTLTVWGPAVPLVAASVVDEHGPRSFGLISSALGAGTILGGLLALRLRPLRMLRAGALAFAGFALYPASVGAHLPVPAIALCMAVAGAGMSFWGVMWSTSIQTQVPTAVLNRVSAYDLAGSLVMLPVGQALAGPASSLFGTGRVLLGSGVMTLAVSGALLAVPAVRRLRRADAPEDR
ncbi:MFS transporter [Streptomyces sp. NPDC048269]|uniref:MFS transporter n=1 Tax=Streptomyces sp. NPDC048269 TaxID=3155753 RepID=UPI003420E2F2